MHWKQANYSRKVTKVRYTVEVAIGKIKSRFRYLDKVIQNKCLPQIGTDFRIAASILNLFFKPIESDVNFQLMIVNKMLEREDQPNTLIDFVDKHD